MSFGGLVALPDAFWDASATALYTGKEDHNMQ